MNNLQEKFILNEIIYMWLEEKEEIKIQSRQRYENLIKIYLENSIGRIEVNKISQKEIIDFFKKDKLKHACPSIQKSVFYILRSALNIAFSNKWCDYIDLKKIKFKTRKNNITVFTKKDQRKLDEYLTKEINVRKLVLLICMYTGIRIGEASALKWEDINFNNKSISINKTVQRIKNNDKSINRNTVLFISTPKSESSNRVVPLPNFLMPYLKKMKSKNEYFILSENETLYDPRLFESFYQRTLKKCKIQHLKFHTLRHTFATRCIESKVDPKTLSEILGHSSIEITLKLYVHPTYDMKKRSIEKMTSFIKKTSSY